MVPIGIDFANPSPPISPSGYVTYRVQESIEMKTRIQVDGH
jgi:hypothetical protein